MVTKSIALAAAMLAILVTGSPNVQGDQFLKTPALRPTNFTETAAAMEAAIQNLMLDKSGFGATPMGGSVKQIQNTLTKTMMPKVLDAHKADQRELNKLVAEIKKCGTLKNNAFKAAAPSLAKYKSQSRYHKRCRADEAVKFTSMKNCLAQEKSLHVIKKLKCNAFAATSKQLGTSKNNAIIVRKGGGESVLSYVTRLSLTFCGRHVHGKKGTKSMQGGWGGGLANGFLDKYLRAKDACEVATKNYNNKVRECRRKTRDYNTKKGKCNQYQTLMDAASCKHAIIILNACEAYAGCYYIKVKSYQMLATKVRYLEVDRKAEWRGLKRMTCLIKAFADGKVTNAEVNTCKKESHSTALLNIKYPKIPKPVKCITPTLYPSTGAYKRREFAPLPALAKGKQSVECSGVKSIATKPRGGSPKTCKCNRLAIYGPYSAGAMVKCTKCLDARKSRAKNSCPLGTKIFSPASRKDWKTFLSSAGPLRAPHWVIDVTRPQNGCGGCATYPMNSGNRHQQTWRTSDKTPWWLRSTRYNEPNGDYNANCYLDLWKPARNENSITFNDNRCNYHAKSYYCQAKDLKISPRKGSPKSCKCTKIDLAASYSAGTLVKCEQCWTVSTSTQRNSCPAGMKIFSPRSRADWKTFLSSAGPLRAPHWIVDVTRPQNGCGGCTRYPMKSSTAQQATWRTSDGSPWWLRSSRYNEPNGDYNANCFLDLWKTPNTENNIQFNDHRCNYRSRSYYCQTVKPKPPAPPPPPPPPRFSRTEAQARAYCYSLRWKVSWRSSRSIICTAPGTGAGANCNTCSTWRLVVFKDGGTDMSPAGQRYHTKVGHFYCGHKPCVSGWNLPYGGKWNVGGNNGKRKIFVWQRSKYPQNAHPSKFCPAGSTYLKHACGTGAQAWTDRPGQRVQWGPYTGNQYLTNRGGHCATSCDCNSVKIACVSGFNFVDVVRKYPQNRHPAAYCPSGTSYVKHVCGSGYKKWTGSQKVQWGPYSNNPYLTNRGHCATSCDCNSIRVMCQAR